MHTTLTGRYTDDPYFDPKSLRSAYHEWHDVEVLFEDRQPIEGCDLIVSYRAYVQYTDAGDSNLVRVELLETRSAEDFRRGRAPKSRALTAMPGAAGFGLLALVGLAALLRADAESESGRRQIADDIAKHRADRDEDFGA